MTEARIFADSHSIPVLELSLEQMKEETLVYEMIKPYVSGSGTSEIDKLLQVKLGKNIVKRGKAEPEMQATEDSANQDTIPAPEPDKQLSSLNRKIKSLIGIGVLLLLLWMISIGKNLSLKVKMDTMEEDKNRIIYTAANAYPIVISDVTFTNRKQGGEIITKANEKIYSSKTQYIAADLHYYGLKDDYISLDIKFITPSGTMSTGKHSPKSYSFSQSAHVFKGYNTLSLDSWGGSRYGHWGRGNYRYEVWSGGRVLYIKYFTVH